MIIFGHPFNSYSITKLYALFLSSYNFILVLQIFVIVLRLHSHSIDHFCGIITLFSKYYNFIRIVLPYYDLIIKLLQL